MLKVIILIGAPASGKSTWSTEFLANHPRYVKIGRDEFRYMLQNKGFLAPALEKMITELVEQAVSLALDAKYNVIIDNTSVKLTYINRFKQLIAGRATIEYKVFDVPLETLISRDERRERAVGQEVIEKLYKDLQNLRKNNKCPNCDGKGRVTRDVGITGDLTFSLDCEPCHGSGIYLNL